MFTNPPQTPSIPESSFSPWREIIIRDKASRDLIRSSRRPDAFFQRAHTSTRLVRYCLHSTLKTRTASASQPAIRLALESLHPLLLPIIKVLGHKSLSNQPPQLASLQSSTTQTANQSTKTHIILLLLTPQHPPPWIHLTILPRITPMPSNPQTHSFLLTDLLHLPIMPFIPQGRGRRQDERRANHDGHERQAKKEEGSFGEVGAVFGAEFLAQG